MSTHTCSVGLLLAAVALAQPRVIGTTAETRALTGDLAAQVANLGAGADPVWIAYSVPVIAGERNLCCNSNYYGGCALEPHNEQRLVAPSTPIKLEPAKDLFILLRTQLGQITKVRSYSSDCELDGTGAKFIFLTGVSAPTSLRYLDNFVRSRIGGNKDSDKLAEAAIAAIALHADGVADTLLDQYVGPQEPESLRRKVVFWLGVNRGRHGYETLRKILAIDKDERVREAAIHALAESKEPEAMKAVIEAARNDPNPRLRGTALFWLAQRAGKQAVGPIRLAIDNDPEWRVKERAVFALSQLPREEGVPLLMEVARNNKSADVRKKAMFWLGQSKDPRAVNFFEEILRKP